jgi:hypothetical protein
MSSQFFRVSILGGVSVGAQIQFWGRACRHSQNDTAGAPAGTPRIHSRSPCRLQFRPVTPRQLLGPYKCSLVTCSYRCVCLPTTGPYIHIQMKNSLNWTWACISLDICKYMLLTASFFLQHKWIIDFTAREYASFCMISISCQPITRQVQNMHIIFTYYLIDFRQDNRWIPR